MAVAEHRERELKFDIPADWTMPQLSELVPGGSVERAEVRLQSTYFDTPARDLLRSRLTLRRRVADGANDGPGDAVADAVGDEGWQLKVPTGDARTEIRLPLDGDGVPAELRTLTAGATGGSDLTEVATLRTERSVYRLIGADGQPLAEVVLDAVTASRPDELPDDAAWREVEVELVRADEAFLQQVAKHLVAHGARPASAGSKLARALGTDFTAKRDMSRLSGLLGAYLDAQADELIRRDVQLRRGRNDVHKARVATRRYRSILRVAARYLDQQRAQALDAELKWYAEALGAVRDRDVLRSRLEALVDEVPVELRLGPVPARIVGTLEPERARAAEALDVVLHSPRYFELLREVRAWREQLPIVADEPAKRVRRLLKKAKRKVKRRRAAAGAISSQSHEQHELHDLHDLHDEAMHRIRKAAKRSRYAAELARPELGREAKRVRKQMKALQAVLGERQDQVMTAALLRRAGLAAHAAGENAFTYGLLWQRQRSAADAVDADA